MERKSKKPENGDKKPTAEQASKGSGAAAITRRRLLKATAYAAPFVATFGMPKGAQASTAPLPPTKNTIPCAKRSRCARCGTGPISCTRR